MKTILLVHGPNLNWLGRRAAKHYGRLSLAQIETLVRREAKKFGLKVLAFQSNHEGALIDFLQERAKGACGIVINPGALAHYSYALYDALLDAGLPAVEVHLSDIGSREAWRKKSVTAAACQAVIAGKKEKGYAQAVKKLAELINFQL